ncbi:hypothetical protein XENOCAPTIV_019291 [Xenoophorus captivus]|uniref:Uncharacterized protein n=1 Tax=Xenoophorus captivus TaxID=1517983 RepID=A0ABV0QDQ7_9TELE
MSQGVFLVKLKVILYMPFVCKTHEDRRNILRLFDPIPFNPKFKVKWSAIPQTHIVFVLHHFKLPKNLLCATGGLSKHQIRKSKNYEAICFIHISGHHCT